MLKRNGAPPRVVLVTGASSGLGKATAALLARKGFRVFGTSRKPQNDARDGFEMLPLDVTSDVSTADCMDRVLERAGRVDILINNAGFGLFGALEELSIEEAHAQFETNFFGVVRMVNAVLPTMRSQKRGQIINVGSLAGLMALPFLGHYSASKYALEGYTEALRQEVWPLNIRVSVAEPGFFKTSIAEAQRYSVRTLPDYAGPRRRIYETLQRETENGKNPALFARLVLGIINSRSPRLRYRAGSDAVWAPRLQRLVPAALFEAGVRRRFGLD